MKPKTYKYNTGATFKIDGVKFDFATQLYQLGIYGIWNGNSGMQGNYSPNQMQKLFKKIKKDFADGKITDLLLGRDISITTDEKGFYIEKE